MLVNLMLLCLFPTEQYTFPAEARAILVLLAVVLVGALGLLGIWVYFWNKIITGMLCVCD